MIDGAMSAEQHIALWVSMLEFPERNGGAAMPNTQIPWALVAALVIDTATTCPTDFLVLSRLQLQTPDQS